MRLIPLLRESTSVSFSNTGICCKIMLVAIPDPIIPPPTIAALRICLGFRPWSVTPGT
ncbi:hypothetical protein Mapa_001843 [Marchantia paleacea]|nr:hypothetical protein Mapa_001843 [Marchantia paleacea]